MEGAEIERVRCGGVRWEVVRAEAEMLRGEVFERVEELEEAAEAVRVKRTVRRTLYQVGLSDGRRVLVKVFRAKSRWDRVVRAALPCRARQEWRASRRLGRMSLPASRAVALGHPMGWRWDVLAWLVIDLERDVLEPGEHLREVGASADERVAFVAALARFVRRFHDAGIRQHDLHAGNVLVRQGNLAAEERFVLIDLQRVRFGRPPGAPHRAQAVAQLLMGLDVGMPTPEVVNLFLAIYHGSEPLLGSSHLTPGHIQREMARLAAVRLESRARRCLLDSSKFAVETVAGARVYHLREYPAADLMALVDEHREALAQPPHTVTCPGADGATTLELVWHAPRGWLGRLLPTLRRAPGLGRYADAHRRRLSDPSAPRAVAAIILLRGRDRGASVAILER